MDMSDICKMNELVYIQSPILLLNDIICRKVQRFFFMFAELYWYIILCICIHKTHYFDACNGYIYKIYQHNFRHPTDRTAYWNDRIATHIF